MYTEHGIPHNPTCFLRKATGWLYVFQNLWRKFVRESSDSLAIVLV